MGTRNSRGNSLYGYPNPQSVQFPDPFIEQRDPKTSDEGVPGQLWINQASQTAFYCVGTSGGSTIWITSPSGAGSFTSLDVNPGDVTIDAGNLFVTLGNITAGGSLTAASANIGPTTLASVAVTGNATVGGTLGVTGATTVAALTASGTVTTNGALVVNGAFTFNDAAAFHVTSTDNVAGAISLTTNGGTSETMVFTNTQGTNAAAIDLEAVAGGVKVFGAAGVAVTTTNTAISLSSGTGAVSISADAAATTVNIGTGAAVIKTINIGGTGANVIAIGNTQTGGSISLGASMTTGTISIGGRIVNIATGSSVNTVVIGSTNTTSALTLQAGSGGVTVTGNTVVTGILRSTGIFTATGAVVAGGAAVINTGTDAASPQIIAGSGVPTFAATQGSIYLRTDGTTTNDRAFIATDSAGTWTALTTAA